MWILLAFGTMAELFNIEILLAASFFINSMLIMIKSAMLRNRKNLALFQHLM